MWKTQLSTGGKRGEERRATLDLTLGVVVFEEESDDVGGGRTGEGVPSDTDAESLTESDLCGLVDGFVRQRTGPGDDSCKTKQWNGTGENRDQRFGKGEGGTERERNGCFD